MKSDLMNALNEYDDAVRKKDYIVSFFKNELTELIVKEFNQLNNEFDQNTYKMGPVVDHKTEGKEIKIKIAYLGKYHTQNESIMNFYLDTKNNYLVASFLDKKLSISLKDSLETSKQLRFAMITYIKSCLINNLYQD